MRIEIELENLLKAARSRFNVTGVGLICDEAAIVIPLRSYVMNETSLSDPCDPGGRTP